MNENKLFHLTIREAGDLLRTRQLSPVELTQVFLSRIDAVDARLESYVTVVREEALVEARIAEAEILRGDYRGPLHGIPLAHKDQFDAKGIPTGARPDEPGPKVAAEDATAVSKLRDAGSVFLGKLVMFGAVDKTATGPPDQARNPWNLDHASGGSSSGSGAAVAAGLCMGSLGEDTAGSIRIPAAYCGVVGLKPTYGRIGRRGLAPISWNLDHAGTMTWTVEDAALMLQALAGPEPGDPTSSLAPVPDYAGALLEDVKGITVGVPRRFIAESGPAVEPETMSAFDQALAHLESQGAHVIDVEVPGLFYGTIANIVIWFADTFVSRLPDMRSRPHIYPKTVRQISYLGALFTSADYVQAQRAQGALSRELAQTFQRVDVLALPTVAEPAPLSDLYHKGDIAEFLRFMAPFNVTGSPAVSMHCGFNSAGLPLAFQLVAKPFDEPTLFRVAHTYERTAAWSKKRPSI